MVNVAYLSNNYARPVASRKNKTSYKLEPVFKSSHHFPPVRGGELIFVLIWFNNLVSSFNIDSRIRYWPSCGKLCINDAIQFPSLDSVSSIFLGLDFFATHQDNFFQGLCSQDKMAAQMVDLRKAQVRFLSSNSRIFDVKKENKLHIFAEPCRVSMANQILMTLPSSEK